MFQILTLQASQVGPYELCSISQKGMRHSVPGQFSPPHNLATFCKPKLCARKAYVFTVEKTTDKSLHML